MASGHAEADLCSALSEGGIFGSVNLDRLLDSIEDLVVTVDGNAGIRAVNAAARRLLGLNAGRMIGRPLLDFLHAGEQTAYMEALHLLRSGARTAVPLRLRITGTDYARRPLATITYPYRSGADELFVLIGRDEARASDTMTILANPDLRRLGRWRYELATGLQSWSSTVSDVMGYANDQRVADDFGMTEIHPDERDAVREVYQRAVASKEPAAFRCRSRDKDGKYRVFENYVFVETDPDGNAVALSGMSHDITKASEAISALHDSVDEMQELFAEISDFIMRINAEGRFQYISPSVKHVLGYEPKELLQERALSLAHPDDTDILLHSVRSLCAVGQSVSIPHRMMHRDGHWVWIEATVRALLMGPNDFPAETVAVCRDITARKRAEEELAAACARAEAASATKSRFLANMSHELRTPLNAIIGFSDIIRRELFGPVGAARYKEYAQLIQESGGHLLDLINDILDMSKIEAGKFDLRFEPVDLGDLIRSSLKLLEPRAQQAKLILTAEIGEDKTHIQADRRAIKQILLNLLTNSIKFTPPGGVVTASLQILTDGVALQVRDTGIGIAEKDLSRVTLPFEQVTHDPLLAQAGSGLGLALVQSLVNLHMGTLKIDSAPGEGTLVTVFLPADPRSRRAA